MDTLIVHADSYGAIGSLFAQGIGHGGIEQVLKTVRKHLGMDVAFVSHFRKGDRVFEYVDAEGVAPLYVGQALSLEEGYCLRVVRGELPQLIPDTSALPEAMAIPETATIPIGSHLSVPIELESGEIYGTLCCFSYEPDLTLGERDLKMLQAFAEVLAGRFAELEASAKSKAAKAAEIRQAMAEGAPRMVFQPLYHLQSREMEAVECLARFDQEPLRTPDRWFLEAHEVGLGQELELCAIEKALMALNEFPETISLGINTSPELVIAGQLHPVLEQVNLKRVVLEMTEHAAVQDYQELGLALRPLRARGLRLAIDDAGAGYASMRHIVNLLPEEIKLDMSLTQNIDTDPSRYALAKALISFARDIGSSVTAEGVETEAELEMLQSLGVNKAQGYFLSKPVSLQEALRLQAMAGD